MSTSHYKRKGKLPAVGVRRSYPLPTRPGGIIATIIKFMSRRRGATVDEALAHVAAAFPERVPARKTSYLNLLLFSTRREHLADGTIRYYREVR